MTSGTYFVSVPHAGLGSCDPSGRRRASPWPRARIDHASRAMRMRNPTERRSNVGFPNAHGAGIVRRKTLLVLEQVTRTPPCSARGGRPQGKWAEPLALPSFKARPNDKLDPGADNRSHRLTSLSSARPQNLERFQTLTHVGGLRGQTHSLACHHVRCCHAIVRSRDSGRAAAIGAKPDRYHSRATQGHRAHHGRSRGS